MAVEQITNPISTPWPNCYRPCLHNQLALAGGPLSPALFPEAVKCCATASQMALGHITYLLQQHGCRYRPSLHNQSTLADDPLSPALFTEAVQRCATASQMAVRHLAAAALAPLTPPEELAPTLLRLLAAATASPAPHLNVVRLWITLVHAPDTFCRPEVRLESLLFCLCHLLQACQHVLMHGTQG